MNFLLFDGEYFRIKWLTNLESIIRNPPQKLLGSLGLGENLPISSGLPLIFILSLGHHTQKANSYSYFDRIDIFFANDEEVKMLTEESILIKAGKQLLAKGPSFVVTKKGEHGAIILGKDFIFSAPAFPCENVVDPTGAGDSFAGGFLGYLDKVRSYTESDIRKAAVYGSVLASFTIDAFSIDRLKTLTLSEIEERYLDFKKLVSFY